MPNLPWTCSCGRKVPWSIAVCRCGKPRPEPGATLSGGAEALAKLPPAESGRDWSWVPKVLGVLALVGLYFGSRMLNRYNASKEARGAAVAALAKVMGPAQAKDAVGRHHDQCFDQYYKTGWGRRQSSSFETEKYARCVLDKLTADLEKDGSARAAAAHAARPARPQPVATMATPTPPPVDRPHWGKVSLGDVKVVEFKREPQLTFKVDFVALGSNLTREAYCSFLVNCQEQAGRAPIVVGCPLQVEGVKGTGTLHYAQAGPAPAPGTCQLELQLSDGSTTRSNTVNVALR